jgi:hypothetical protein
MYHSAQVLLSCPSEQVVWSTTPDLDWLSCPAFLAAQEHAIRATALLSQLVASGTKISQLSAPVGFVWTSDSSVTIRSKNPSS